jgi:hypothetical protein
MAIGFRSFGREDGHRQTKKSGRYFSVRSVLKERSRDLKRVRVGEARKLAAEMGNCAKRPPPIPLGEIVSLEGSLNGPKCSLNGPKCSLNGPKCSLNGPKRSLNGPKCFIHGPKSSLNGPNCSLNGPECSLLGDEETRSNGGESVDEYVLRRTKEFNVATRVRYYDVDVWLQFASFQDQVCVKPSHPCE